MAQPAANRSFRTLVTILIVTTIGLVAFIGGITLLNRPPSPQAVAATLTALPSPTPTATATPTPIPTLPGVSDTMLVCQREASRALNDRRMAGAVNISGDHLFLLRWISKGRVEELDDALAGVILGLDVALKVWELDCALYDRVRIEVYDQSGDEQIHRLTVETPMEDLLKWRAGELKDAALIARLKVSKPGD